MIKGRKSYTNVQDGRLIIQLFLLLFLSIPITQHINAQFPAKTEYAVETGMTSGKGSYAPMWLTANRQGLSSTHTENGYLRAGIAHTMPLGSHFGFSAELDLATAYNFTSSFIIQQAYADLGYRWLNLSIGSKDSKIRLCTPHIQKVLKNDLYAMPVAKRHRVFPGIGLSAGIKRSATHEPA